MITSEQLVQGYSESRETAEKTIQLNMKRIIGIANLEELTAVDNITLFNLACNYLKYIDPLFLKCTKLRILDLSINMISQIQYLENLVNLTKLNISKNRIIKIQGLDTLTKLRDLDLGHNRIEVIENLPYSLSSLDFLSLAGNRISKLEGLEFLVHLQRLEMNRNELSEIAFLAIMPCKLKYFNGSFNNLSNLEETVRPLLAQQMLESVDLYENPICLDPKYKFRLADNPKLQLIDGMPLRGIVKKQLKEMQTEYQVDTLIEETYQAFHKRIEAKKEMKDMVVHHLNETQKTAKVRFKQYESEMEKELKDFVTYVNHVRLQQNKGEEQLTDDKVREWANKLQELETIRQDEERRDKDILEGKLKDKLAAELVQKSYLDKLYEIAMDKPDLWRVLKRREYEIAQREEYSGVDHKVQERKQDPRWFKRDENADYMNQMISGGQGEVQTDLYKQLGKKYGDGDKYYEWAEPKKNINPFEYKDYGEDSKELPKEDPVMDNTHQESTDPATHISNEEPDQPNNQPETGEEYKQDPQDTQNIEHNPDRWYQKKGDTTDKWYEKEAGHTDRWYQKKGDKTGRWYQKKDQNAKSKGCYIF